MNRRLLSAITIGLIGASLMAGTVLAAHNGNNRAFISGTGDPDASGVAIVNYSEGTGKFNGNITVANLDAGESYTFLVRSPNGLVETVVCTGTADANGTFTCSAQKLTLGGFAKAVVRDAAGVEVAVGTFDRRGNCRDADQAGSQCEAQRP